MKLLFDQNISHRILYHLTEDFKGSTTIKSEALLNAKDKEIWDFAKDKDFSIVTQDSDFNDLNSLYGPPPKVIWIRTGNLKTEELANLLIKNFAEIEKFLKDQRYGCFEIVRFQ